MDWTDQAIAYLRKHRAYVQRDLDAIRSGHVKVSDNGVDVAPIWIGRHEREIGYLDAIISAYENRGS